MSLAVTPALPLLAAERPRDAPAVERIVMRAFGPGRYAKAAERLREGNSPILELSFVAWARREPVGCVRLWPVEVGETAALLLGPIAVDAAQRGNGLGASLVECACAAATTAGHALVILVGDEPFFGPLGFSAKAGAKVLMPGPVDQRRVLVRALKAGADAGLEGLVTA